MHTKTMEGLTGASVNMKILNTPFRVYKEAERRGDTDVMQRAMGYVGEFSDKVQDYQKKAEKGLEEEAKEAREKAKIDQENTIKKRKEEREELKKRIAESRDGNTDTVSISKNAKAGLDEKSDSELAGTDSISVEETADIGKKESVIYTKTGEAARPKTGVNFSFSV